MRAAVIANPVKVDVAELRAALGEVERAYGYEPSLVLETTAEDAGAGQARAALDAGVALVVAAGGDGTVRLVAGELAGSGVPLGLVPAGTGNLLARNLGLTDGVGRVYGIADALRVAFGGATRGIDLGEVQVERADGATERLVFTVIAGIGIDAGMIAHTNERLKARVGWVAYASGVVRWLASSGAFRARYRVGAERTWGTRAAGIMFANAGSLPGGFALLPDARLDDGRVDMVVMRPSGPLGWAQVAAGVIAQNLPGVRAQRRSVKFFQGERMLVRVDSGPQAFEVDGDAAGEAVALRAGVRPGALRVRVPA